MKVKYLVLAAVLAFFVGCGNDTKLDPSQSMSGETLAKIQADNKEKENYLVIDVRSKEEYDQGHLKHAINIPFEVFYDRIDEIKGYENKNIVFYCTSGKKSNKLAADLKEKGFTSTAGAQSLKEYNYELFKFGSLNANEFNKLDKSNVLIIDVRAAKDYESGHIEGAISIPDGEPLENYKDILDANKDKSVVTYCYTGNRSANLANKLVEMGFKDVNNLLDGTKEYDYNLVK